MVMFETCNGIWCKKKQSGVYGKKKPDKKINTQDLAWKTLNVREKPQATMSNLNHYNGEKNTKCEPQRAQKHTG